MTDKLAEWFNIDHDRAAIIVRTFWQAIIAMVFVLFLQIINSLVDLFKEGLATGMGAVVLTAALTVAGAFIDNVRAYRKFTKETPDVDTSGD